MFALLGKIAEAGFTSFWTVEQGEPYKSVRIRASFGDGDATQLWPFTCTRYHRPVIDVKDTPALQNLNFMMTSRLRPKLVSGSRTRKARERRLSQRIPFAVPVFAKGIDDRGKEFLEFTTTLNISLGGALIAMRRYQPVPSKVTLEIPAAPLPRLSAAPTVVRTMQANVIRVTPSEPSFMWALQFIEPLQ